MYFEIYQEGSSELLAAAVGSKGKWRWRLKGANHEPIAQGEDYVNKADCESVVDLLKSTTASTPVKYV